MMLAAANLLQTAGPWNYVVDLRVTGPDGRVLHQSGAFDAADPRDLPDWAYPGHRDAALAELSYIMRDRSVDPEVRARAACDLLDWGRAATDSYQPPDPPPAATPGEAYAALLAQLKATELPRDEASLLHSLQTLAEQLLRLTGDSAFLAQPTPGGVWLAAGELAVIAEMADSQLPPDKSGRRATAEAMGAAHPEAVAEAELQVKSAPETVSGQNALVKAAINMITAEGGEFGFCAQNIGDGGKALVAVGHPNHVLSNLISSEIAMEAVSNDTIVMMLENAAHALALRGDSVPERTYEMPDGNALVFGKREYVEAAVVRMTSSPTSLLGMVAKRIVDDSPRTGPAGVELRAGLCFGLGLNNESGDPMYVIIGDPKSIAHRAGGLP